jgi:hypothetical protein
MHKRLVGIIVFIIFMESLLVPTSLSSDGPSWWNDDWSYRQEIPIPINTSSEEAKFQPIDIYLEFNDSCWAKNENEHSIRVIFQESGKFIELDSQIYELNYSDNEHISSCNLVFLIPQEANGNEKYYIYYDDEKKSSPNYTDYVNIQESYYQYEPLQGFKFESNFYKIIENGYIVYAINKKGTYLGDTVSQQITKLKKGSKEVKPSSGEQVISLSFVYWWLKNGIWSSFSSVMELVSNQIFVDGNLMVKFGIISQSSDKLLKTTVYYKYYYCPTENKRIYTHTKHEIIGYPLPLGEDIDLAFVIFPFARLKSSSINELNFGEIPKYLHFYSADDRIVEYEMDQYPEPGKFQEMIGKKDDYDIGNHSWLSADSGETGIAHSIIFETNKIVKFGGNERDGMELQLCEANSIQLPGLDGAFAYLYVMRNAYEAGVPLNIELPQGYIAEFNSEFFSTETGGYKAVEKEADIYQKLIGYQPDYENDLVEGGEEKEEYSLITYVHLPLTLLPKLWGIKAILKKTHVSAELYDGNNLIAYGRVSRVSLTDNIKIDWKNISLFRKIIFLRIPSGKYIVKIWLENTLFGDNRKFIGYDIVDIQKDTTVHVFCKHEGKIRAFIYNQNKQGIENAQISLIKENFVIFSNTSDSKGRVLIEAPCGFREKYTLNVTYKGFLISSENIRLGRFRRFLPIIKKFNFPVYDLTIDFKNSEKQKPTFNVNLSLTSSEMQNPIFLYPDSESNAGFYFKSLYPANYTLSIKYNQFEVKEVLQVPNIESMTIELYDLTVYLKDNWNFTPYPDLDVNLRSDDFEKAVVISAEKSSSGEYLFTDLYPGNYTLKISYLDHSLVTPIVIPYGKDGETTIVFPAEFNSTIKVFDTHGNPLKDAEVLIARTENGEKKHLLGFTDEDGKIIFSLPPGTYNCEIYNDKDLVAKRKIDALNEKIYDVVTKSEPIFLNVLITIFIILIIVSLFVSFRKKDTGFFLKFFALGIVIIALLSPWWSINGLSGNQSETSTNLFLMPTKMVTISSNENFTAGEIASLDKTFVFVLDLIPIVIIIGLLCIATSMLLNKYNKKGLSLIFFILTLIIFVGSIITFSYAMSEFTNTTVGSFYGNGSLDIAIPGEKMYVNMFCSWNPSIGFYLILISIIVLTADFLLYLKKIFYKKF